MTGGGFKVPNDNFGYSTSAEYKVTSSAPYGAGAWKATARVIKGTYSSTRGWTFSAYNYTPYAYALCTR